MADIVIMKKAVDVNNQNVIELLEELLNNARAGELQMVAVAILHCDGGISAAWSAGNNVPPLLGAITLLQQRLVQRIDDEE